MHSVTESLWGIQTDRRSAHYSIDQVTGLLLSASCLHGSHAVDVVARNGRGVSWYPSHLIRSTLQWGYYSLACDANHVTRSDWRTGYFTRFRNLMPSLQARRTAGMRYTLQYCSQENSRASTDRGLLTRYMCGRAFDGAFKALCASWFAFMAAQTQWC